MQDVYACCPTYENELITLRPLRENDADALLACYSDEHAVAFFNSDNCQDDFHYETLSRMQEAVAMWLDSYEKHYFVRWVIEDGATSRAIGTVEMFHMDATEQAKSHGVLRVDVQSPYETRGYLLAILRLCLAHFYEDFDVEQIITKSWPRAVERRTALETLGFTPTTFRDLPYYYQKEKD